jgi:predicted O-linked N-acetylglucosamine transferase (SPINDLY family)
MCAWPILNDSIRGLSPDDLMANCGPLAALALTDQVTVQARVAGAWILRKIPPAPEYLAPRNGYRHDRIRVGYLSSDFCRHAMSYLIAELFERHDRSRFEIHGYCTSPEDGSDIRRRVIAAFDHFTIIKDMTDEAAARVIRADEIDILIDLNGLTTGSRMAILRWRPAPVQATYLGFIGPVPMPELDFLLCDEFVIPPAYSALYQPRPLYVAPNYQANDQKRVIGDPVTREMSGLPEDRFIFCCFSNHYKITETMFSAWLEILRRVEDSVLWLVSDNIWSRDNLRTRAIALDIDPARLLFAERTDPATYMARLALPDLFLDTFPYNAGTIASDAIRMGLPLVTLSGESFASRMAGRLLQAIGATPGITETVEQYVETAIALANQPAVLAQYRSLFTQANWAATIGDIATFTYHYEDSLIQIELGSRARDTEEPEPVVDAMPEHDLAEAAAA